MRPSDASEHREQWLGRLSSIVAALERRWSIRVAGNPSPDATCSWVAPVERSDGSRAILKIGLPHMEARDEARGLRFWAGDPTVRLLESDPEDHAMLLERCEPGTSLRGKPEPKQDTVVAGLLQRLWRAPPAGEFRHLSAMIEHWAGETRLQAERWADAGLVREGLGLFETLSRPGTDDVLLATDLHAGNVLAARRRPWLVIDPKPFVGDPAYDATQHLLNCVPRLEADPAATIARVADLLGVDGDRVRAWLFARLAAEPRDRWDGQRLDLAKRLSRHPPSV